MTCRQIDTLRSRHDRPRPATTQTARRWLGRSVRAAAAAGRRAGVFCPGPRCGRRDDPRVHGAGRGRPLRARCRDVALPVSLYGKGQQAAGCAAARACRGAGGRRGGRAMLSGAGARCRRQIVRRPHDVAGTGARAAGRRPRTGLSWLSACTRQASRPTHGPNTSAMSMSPCSSSRAPATSWPN